VEEVKKEEEKINNDKQKPEESSEKKLDKNEETFKEKYLRLNADFQNFKKRMTKERAEWMHVAQVHVFEKVLPVFDEFDRALTLAQEHSEKTKLQDVQVLLDGFKLIQKNAKKIFKELKIQEIDTSHDFNPEHHEALMQVESDEKESGQIVCVLSKGYMLDGKVIKHAKVSVAK